MVSPDLPFIFHYLHLVFTDRGIPSGGHTPAPNVSCPFLICGGIKKREKRAKTKERKNFLTLYFSYQEGTPFLPMGVLLRRENSPPWPITGFFSPSFYFWDGYLLPVSWVFMANWASFHKVIGRREVGCGASTMTLGR